MRAANVLFQAQNSIWSLNDKTKTLVFGGLNLCVFVVLNVRQTKWRMCQINTLRTFRWRHLLVKPEKTYAYTWYIILFNI